MGNAEVTFCDGCGVVEYGSMDEGGARRIRGICGEGIRGRGFEHEWIELNEWGGWAFGEHEWP